MLTAESIMSENVVTVYDDMLVKQVAHLMLRQRVSVFPVKSRQTEEFVGIVTMTDFFQMVNSAFRAQPRNAFRERISSLKEIPVSLLMSRKMVMVTPETTLEEIVQMVLERNIHSFPVMKDKKMIGIISRHDILNAVYVYY